MVKMHKVLSNIPEEFVVESNRGGQVQYFPKYGGLLYLANTMGRPILKTKIIDSKTPNEICAECEAYLIPNEETLKKLGITSTDDPFIDMFKMPIIAHGTVNPGNTKDNMLPHATVLAETRAKARALRDLTGCSYTSFEEMQESSPIGEPMDPKFTVASAADMLKAENGKSSTAFSKTEYDREAYIKELSMFARSQPYKAIIDRVNKEFKVASFTGLPDDGIKRVYELCRDSFKGQ